MSLAEFEFGKELGKGAFGSVHIVKRKEDGKTYAMKRVKIAQLSQKERENALNEIRLLASLSYINIIGYKEAFFDEISKTINIVMELADDGDLQSKIKANSKSRLSFRECTIWSILIQILQGIKYLHDNNIMHRDIKSANLFLMKSGIVKIGDLNVSKIAKMGMAYTQTGTPYYASPEVWKDKPYDYKSDIWSIGCIVYEMCTLRPPFRGTSLPNLFQNIQKGIYESIPSVYSPELSKVISFMLQVNPNSRMTSDQLLKTDIIIEKMKETQSIDMKSDLDSHVDLIKTIKIPKNMKEINRALPNKRYKNREEMMANDEFETKKADFFKEVNNNMMNAINRHQNTGPKEKKKQQNIANSNHNALKKNEVNVSESNNKKKISTEEKKRIQRANEYLQKEKENAKDIKKQKIINNNVYRPISGKPAVLNHHILNKNSHNNNKENKEVIVKKEPINNNKPKSNIIMINNSNKHRPITGKAASNHINIKQSSNKKVISSEHIIKPKYQPPTKAKPISSSNNHGRVSASNPVKKKKVIIEKLNYQGKAKQYNKLQIHPASAMAKNRKIAIHKLPQDKKSSGNNKV